MLSRDFVPIRQQCVRSPVSASRYGLSQRELTDLLDPNDPQGNVAALLRLLRPYLMHRGRLLDFYHTQFRRAAIDMSLRTSAQRTAAHEELAEYYQDQDDFDESLDEQRARVSRLPPSPRSVNLTALLARFSNTCRKRAGSPTKCSGIS